MSTAGEYHFSASSSFSSITLTTAPESFLTARWRRFFSCIRSTASNSSAVSGTLIRGELIIRVTGSPAEASPAMTRARRSWSVTIPTTEPPLSTKTELLSALVIIPAAWPIVEESPHDAPLPATLRTDWFRDPSESCSSASSFSRSASAFFRPVTSSRRQSNRRTCPASSAGVMTETSSERSLPDADRTETGASFTAFPPAASRKRPALSSGARAAVPAEKSSPKEE